MDGQEIIRILSRACQIFTSGLGTEDGYFPNIGGPKTQEALRLMKKAGVKPVFFSQAHESQDPFIQV